ncbi:MAG: DUF2092 domain-containing protein [Planctomycetota bacterium]|jgi:hypothetical protein
MKIRTLLILIGATVVGAAGVAGVAAQTTAPQADSDPIFDPDIYRIDPDADLVLRIMGDYLASMDEFSFRADIAYDEVRHSGHRLQFGAVGSYSVRRPGQIRADYRGDQRQSTAYLNNGTLSYLNRGKNVYSRADVPEDIDDALDHIFDEYGITVPIADFLYANPYDSLITHAWAGDYVGLHTVDGELCHHLVFHQEDIDWQIWVARGPRPVPRKLVITYRAEDGIPQYSARLSKWNFDPKHSDHFFVFRAPEGADEVIALPREKDGE